MRKNPKILIAIFLIGLGLGAVFAYFRIPPKVSPETSSSLTVPSPSKEFVEANFKAKEDFSVPNGTRILIVPHHLIASRQIASLLNSTPKPEEVLLISPNHFLIGHTAIVASSVPWKSEYGITTPSESLDSLINSAKSSSDSPYGLQKEHGIYGLIPFIQRAYPDTKISAATLRYDASTEVTQNFATQIAEYLKSHPKTLFIATIDFSHYQSTQIADLHDLVSADAMLSLDSSRARKSEVDDPALLEATLLVAKKLELGNVAIHAHTNSIRIAQSNQDANSTSHFFVTFSPGVAMKSSQFVSADMTSLDLSGREDYDEIMGEERRTLDGFDELLVTRHQYEILSKYPGLKDDLKIASRKSSQNVISVKFECETGICSQNITVIREPNSRLYIESNRFLNN
ncbi:MAG: AmmeMemoRadiSam system protein B [bacterium]